MNPIDQEHNRYLKSPYVIQDTCLGSQKIFETKNNIIGENFFNINSFEISINNSGNQLKTCYNNKI